MKLIKVACALLSIISILLIAGCGEKIDEIRDGAIESFRDEHGGN